MMLHAHTAWEPLGEVSLSALREARMQLHHLVQIIPAFGAALLEPEDDDGHRSMTWDTDLQGFRSRRVPEVEDLYVVIRPLPLEVQIRAAGSVERYVLPGHSLDEAFDWTRRELAAHLGREDVPLERPEYEIPDHPVAHHALFDASPAALEELGRWYDNATHLLGALRDDVRTETTPLRAWPHHFDVAFRILLPAKSGPEGRGVGVGMSPGDESHPDPYWYVRPWPDPETGVEEVELPWGSWYTDSWSGARFGAPSLLDEDRRTQAHRVRAFLEAATRAGRVLLGG